MKITGFYGDEFPVRVVETIPPVAGVEAAEIWVHLACVAEVVTSGWGDRMLAIRALCGEIQDRIDEGAYLTFDANDWPVLNLGPGKALQPCWRLDERCAVRLLRNGASAATVLELLSRPVPVRWSERARAAAAVEDTRRAPERDGQFAGKARRAYQIAYKFGDLANNLRRVVAARRGIEEAAAHAWLVAG